jgi:hypothetical protein
MKATIVDESRRGMGLRLPAPVPPGSPVKIECGDQLILGEITHCSTAGGRYHAGLIVKHRLPGLADLHRLNRALREHQQQPQDEPAALIMGR